MPVVLEPAVEDLIPEEPAEDVALGLLHVDGHGVEGETGLLLVENEGEHLGELGLDLLELGVVEDHLLDGLLAVLQLLDLKLQVCLHLHSALEIPLNLAHSQLHQLTLSDHLQSLPLFLLQLHLHGLSQLSLILLHPLIHLLQHGYSLHHLRLLPLLLLIWTEFQPAHASNPFPCRHNPDLRHPFEALDLCSQLVVLLQQELDLLFLALLDSGVLVDGGFGGLLGVAGEVEAGVEVEGVAVELEVVEGVEEVGVGFELFLLLVDVEVEGGEVVLVEDGFEGGGEVGREGQELEFFVEGEE